MGDDMLTAAMEYMGAGLSVLPCRLPEKRPDPDLVRGGWKRYQAQAALEAEVRAWFGPGQAIAIIGGAVSGGLEMLDFDEPEAWDRWREVMWATCPGLGKRLVVERTLRGGVHVFYRCARYSGNMKLAHGMRDGSKKCLVETRGEGGYCVVAPSPGYERMHGSPAEVQTISEDERDLLLGMARSLDEMPEAEPEVEESRRGAVAAGDGKRPGDAYNDDPGAMKEVLRRHGWTVAYTAGGVEHWVRPGKKQGTSATWGHVPGKFHVFSSNAGPLEPRAYSPFQVLAILEYGGDFASAARALGGEGYGEPAATPRQRSDRAQRKAELRVVGMQAEQSAVVQEEAGPVADAEVVRLALQGERGVGELTGRMWAGKAVYDHSAGRWYGWAGSGWREWRSGEELAMLTPVCECIARAGLRRKKKASPDGQQQTDIGGRLLEVAQQMTGVTRARNVLIWAAAAGIGGLGISGQEWDAAGEWMLPAGNGVVDLRTGTLQSASPEQYMRTGSSIDYDPEAQCPRWERFLLEIMPDAETTLFLRRLLGYAITGSVREHIFAVLYGEQGRNGKDTLLETLRYVLGPMAAPTSSKNIMQRHHEPDHDSGALDLRGRRVVWASETGERQPLDAAKVKLWTGGGTLKARAPYGRDEVEWAPTHKLFLLTNHKPRVHADDEAMWRRMVLIPFTQSFVDAPTEPHERQVDRNLAATLRAEAKGILAWLVKACMDWQIVGLRPPASVRGAVSDYRDDEDSIGAFLRDGCVAEEGVKVRAKDLYDAYCQWSEDLMRGKPLAAITFGRRVKVHYPVVRGNSGICYMGLRPRRADEEENSVW
jgi:P4 family phage/plasmid primase-like protien